MHTFQLKIIIMYLLNEYKIIVTEIIFVIKINNKLVWQSELLDANKQVYVSKESLM